MLKDLLVDSTQKIKETACETLLALAGIMPQEDCANYVLRTLIELSHNESDE